MADKKKGRRFSPQKREKILARFNQLLQEGTSAVKAAKAVGVSYVTIRSWLKQTGQVKPAVRKVAKQGKAKQGKAKQGKAKQGKAKQGKAKQGKTKQGKTKQGKTKQGKTKRAARRPAKQAARGGGKNLVVVMPNGFRIEGFSMRDLIQLLKSVK